MMQSSASAKNSKLRRRGLPKIRKKYGFRLADKKSDRWQKQLSRAKRKITSAGVLSATQRAIIATHTYFAPILLNEGGAFFFGPSAVAQNVLKEATRKSQSSVKRARRDLVKRGLMAPVRKIKFEGNKSMVEFVVNHPKLRTYSHLWEDPTLDDQIEAALKKSDKPDPFRGLHRQAKQLYLALLKQPDLTNAKLAKKLGVDPRTVKRIKGNLICAGAMSVACKPGVASKIITTFFRPPNDDVVEDYVPLEASVEGVQSTGQRGGQRGGQSPGQQGGQRGDKAWAKIAH